MAYAIGLDCGIASVGWAVLQLDENENPYRIEKLGSRIFDTAEIPKTGASLAAPRREKRGMRRRIRRHKHRLDRIKYLLVSDGVLTQSELEVLFNGQLEDIYYLRTKALDTPISNTDFARVLIHLAQRRGFKSNRKTTSSGDEGKLLTAVKENTQLMDEKGYRTVGEMFYKDEKFSEVKRNKAESYKNTVGRNQIEAETKLIFKQQRQFGNSFASEELEGKYLNILLSQRAFDEGPGESSPYGGNQIEKMIGKCTFEPEEPRAVKASYSFEYFTLLQNINNLRILSNGSVRPLGKDEKLQLRELAHKKATLTYTVIRKELRLREDEYFKNLSYGKKPVEEVEKAKFEYLKAFHKMRKALDKVAKDRINVYGRNQRDDIAYAFTVFKTDDGIKQYLLEHDIAEWDVEALINKISGFSKTGHLSLKALRKITPFLEEGMRYDEACQQAGYDFRAHEEKKSKFLPASAPELDDITNPVVRRAVSQIIKVVNAIIREQGESPTYINVELAREMSKTFDERNKIKKSNEDNRTRNDKIKKEIAENFKISDPKGLDIVKVKLFHEQDKTSPYFQKKIEYAHLLDTGYVDVDHIIPYSRSFDDSYNNKILVLSSENRDKGNRLPMEWLSGKAKDDFEIYVNTSNTIGFRKKQNLLKESLSDLDGEFKERNLTDTKYISKVILNFLKDRLIFAESSIGRKKRVTAVNGRITAYVRSRWGIQKIRANGDLHHAVDAVVIACITDGMINRISKYSKNHEIRYVPTEQGSLEVDERTGKVISEFPFPWPKFRNELEIRVSNNPERFLQAVRLPNYEGVELNSIKPCFVSRMPKRKVTGSVHEDTVRGIHMDGQKPKVVSKKALTELKLVQVGETYEIKNYYNPSSDRILYEALIKRLKENRGDAKKAFAEPFYKPTASGEQGPLVKKVKIEETNTLSVPVYGGTGFAKNETMVRLDVFYVKGEGYYFVPIYVADTIQETLPSKGCIQKKEYNCWKDLEESDFVFSLYPNDLIHIKREKPFKLNLCQKESTLEKEKLVSEELLYYVGFDIAAACAKGITNNNTYEYRSIGKTTTLIEKYEVDVLGNYHKVKKERRLPFKSK